MTSALRPAPGGSGDSLFAGLVFGACLLPLLAAPVLPLIDFYNHIARYHVLATIGADPVLAANYVARWQLVPNLGLDVIGAALARWVPALTLGKVVVVLIFAVQFTGALALHRALGGTDRRLAALLVAPLLFSFILNWGFSNFLLGLGLALWGLAWWVRMRDRPALALPVAMIVALAVFLTHGVAFALYGLLAGGLEIGRFLQHRKVASLAAGLGMLGVQAVLPALLFLRMPTSGAAGGITNADDALARYGDAASLLERLAAEASYRIETVVRVSEGPSYAFDAVLFAATTMLIVWALARGHLTVARVALPALGLAALLCLIVPPAMFQVGYVADRMPLAFAFLLAASLMPAFRSVRARNVTLGLLALLLGVRLVANAVEFSGYRQGYADFTAVAAEVPRGALVADMLVTTEDRRDGLRPRCQMWRPLLLTERGAVVPLFANITQQPLGQRPALDAAIDAVPPRPDFRRQPVGDFYNRQFEAIAAARRFDYLLVCGAARLPRPVPPSARLMAQSGDISLWRLR